MKYSNNYNPYKFIYLFPIAIIAGLVYLIISSWSTLSNQTLVLLIVIIFASITYLGYQISKDNHPLKIKRLETGNVDDIVEKVIKQKSGFVSKAEVENFKMRAKNIYDSTYWRAERTMKIKMLIDDFLKRKNG